MKQTKNKLFMTHKLLSSGRGFTLIEVLMVLLLIGILATASISEFSGGLNESKFDETVNEMNEIRDAMIGNSKMRSGGARTSFGFLGDLGRLPTNAEGISALVTKPGALPAWAVDTAVHFGAGWNGPYLSGGDSGADYTTDAWGNNYVYDSTATPPTLISRGADGAAGGTIYDQDITVSMPSEKRQGDVHGFISDGHGPFDSDAQVEFYSVVAGVVTTTTTTLTAGDNGHFQFASVPYGKRSLTIYTPSIAGATTTIGPILITVNKANVLVPSEQTDINP